jgi:3-deoxy-D-manno-octulosonic-acid transferase
MYLLYSAALTFAFVLALPYWLLQRLRHGKYRAGLAERMGTPPLRLSAQNLRPVIWVHAVSVGEVGAISAVVDGLRKRCPQYRVLVSTTTATGQALARARFGEASVFYFPFDLAFAIRPYLRLLHPALVVIAETEFWPNFLRLAGKNGAKLAVVNARISDRSWPGYRRFRAILSRALEPVDLFLAQTEQDAQRLASIGASRDRIQVSGNLKFDIPLPSAPEIVARLRQAFEQASTGPVIVCGSTVEGEEPLLLHAFENVIASHPRAMMILAPRHPERFPEVAALLEQLKIPYQRRSLWDGQALSGEVLLLDTIGELAAMYGLGDVAFVGGSLVPRGGHNIIEPARHGVAILVGNHTENFRDIVGRFESHDAVRVAGPAEFPLALMDLLSNQPQRQALGARALETLRGQAGATESTLEALQRLLDGSPDAPRVERTPHLPSSISTSTVPPSS